MLTHDVIQNPVNSLSVMKFLGDFSLGPTAASPDKRSEHGPAKGVFYLEQNTVHVLAKGLTYWFVLYAPYEKLKVIHERKC